MHNTYDVMNIPKQISFEEHYILVQYYQNKIKKLQTEINQLTNKK